ncbi:MAG: T9SS type A sorting domain-containing protein [Bacteroidales bacterium]|nr:T9SS type A sorting domain-containing protein [Bacteroidales bacterium]
MKRLIFIQAILFTGFSLFGQSKISYTFDENGNLKSEKFGELYTVNYRYDAEGNLYTKTISGNTGIEENANGKEYFMQVFPNPANNYLILKSDGEIARPASIRVYNYSGQLMSGLSHHHDENGTIILDVSILKEGLYMLVFKENEVQKTIKFMKK